VPLFGTGFFQCGIPCTLGTDSIITSVLIIVLTLVSLTEGAFLLDDCARRSNVRPGAFLAGPNRRRGGPKLGSFVSDLAAECSAKTRSHKEVTTFGGQRSVGSFVNFLLAAVASIVVRGPLTPAIELTLDRSQRTTDKLTYPTIPYYAAHLRFRRTFC
jgi:hypothetical protein